MDLDFDIVGAVEHWGVIGTVVIMVLYFSLKNIIAVVWKKIFNPDKKQLGDLSKHSSFHQLENYIIVKIPSIRFEDPGRTEVFRDMLSIMLQSYTNMMRKIISDSFNAQGDPIYTSNEDFIQKISNYGVLAIKDYEDQWRKVGIPIICIEKFNQWHSNKRDILFTDIQSIANSAFHTSYNEKIAAYFDLIFIVLNISILDAEYILKDLNGELSKKTYKGIIIGHKQETGIIRDDDSSLNRIKYLEKKDKEKRERDKDKDKDKEKNITFKTTE